MDFPAIQKAHYKRQAVTCETCGHTKYKDPHKLSAVHARGLKMCRVACDIFGRAVNRDEMGLNRDGSANGNFAALRWWGFIEQPKPDYWQITPDGRAFLDRKLWVKPHVWTLDGEVCDPPPGTPFEEKISIVSVIGEEAWRKPDYIARRVPVIEPGALVA